jgi:phosphoserine phosphatase RsbU/P
MEASRLETVHVLVVEDNPADAALLDVLLRRVGGTSYATAHAGSLGEGVVVAKGVAQVVLLDLHLPDARGLSDLPAAVQAFGDRPVIVMSGLGDPTVGERICTAGARGWIDKSEFSSAALHRVLDRALRG